MKICYSNAGRDDEYFVQRDDDDDDDDDDNDRGIEVSCDTDILAPCNLHTFFPPVLRFFYVRYKNRASTLLVSEYRSSQALGRVPYVNNAVVLHKQRIKKERITQTNQYFTVEAVRARRRRDRRVENVK
jgi:hypothetical protein